LLYNASRVQLNSLQAGAAAPAVVACAGGRAELVHNPALVEPGHTAWLGGAKPLVVQVAFEGRNLFVIGIDLISKAGDAPRFGAMQPPPRLSDARRLLQAQVVAGFVEQIVRCEAGANVLVLGNANDLPNVWTLAPLQDRGLVNLVAGLPLEERYTTVVDGNSVAYQHAYVSPALLGAAPQADIVHLNAEFAARVSEHDPVVVQLDLSAAAQPQPVLFIPYVGG
jgi:predicted extracellular nuclease